MHIEKNEVSIITLEKEIKVFGLSHLKTGIDPFALWGKKGDILRDVKHVKTPPTQYGIWTPPHPGGDYFVGAEVTAFEGQDTAYSTFTIPPGRYVQVTFNAQSIDQLLTEKIWSCGVEGIGERAALLGVAVNEDDITVEIYPDGLFEMQYPEMFYLWRIKES
ncbi:MAG: GyrI-like domain-containing protein [Defluviitaleaceae bacterium]|nr:GyrI-like domain-containing protein [Defluviitaleaceae bacterium]